MIRLIQIGVACVVMAALCTAADQAQAPTPPAKTGWWLKSSLSEHPIPAKFLYHFQGTLSYMNAEGNTEGSAFEPKAELQVRRWRFTDRFLAEYSRRDLVYAGGGGSVNTTESSV